MTGPDNATPRPARPPAFVIFAAQRTGSTMLVSLLDNHPGLRCFGELFVRNPDTLPEAMAGLPKEFCERFAPYETRKKRWKTYLAGVGRRQSLPWGFKLMNNQLQKIRACMIAEGEARFIVLRRENVLAVHASAEIAARSGQGVAHKGDTVIRTRVRFDRDRFLDHMRRYEAGYARVARTLADHEQSALELDYVRLARTDAETEQKRLLDHLGVPVRPLTADTLRRNPSDILSRFTNPDDALRAIEEIGHPDWASEA